MTPELVARTARLELIAATLDLVQAELEGPEVLGAWLGVPIPASWPAAEYDRDALQFFTAVLVAGGPAAIGWYNWYAISLDAEGRRLALVGAGGYMGPPADDVVEIGYSVVPEARSRGFATEMVEALTTRALAVERVHKVIAHTLESNTRSQGVLKRCGFLPASTSAARGLIRFERVRTRP